MASTQTSVATQENVDRRTRLSETIESLIRLRQEMFVSFCQLAGVRGHFEVYQRIIDGKERRVAVKEVAAKVYPGIADTTNFLVDFNDKYVNFKGSEDELNDLDADLSKLGEVIAVRGDLEDQILAALAAKK